MTGEWCVLDEPITYSAKNDTEQTVRQVQDHNAGWCELCGPHPLCPEK